MSTTSDRENKVDTSRRMLLVDGAGALLSAFLLGFVLVQLNHLIGVPPSTLYLLASIPIFFAIYDFICYYKVQKEMGKYLKIIAYANLAYCAFSIIMMVQHADSLTTLGWIYFIVEIVVVVVIAFIELRLAAA